VENQIDFGYGNTYSETARESDKRSTPLSPMGEIPASKARVQRMSRTAEQSLIFETKPTCTVMCDAQADRSMACHQLADLGR
jgi:hypothetical protein